MAKPKTAQETLAGCVSVVDEILRTREVQDQMFELKVQIGDNGLPLDVRQYVSSAATFIYPNHGLSSRHEGCAGKTKTAFTYMFKLTVQVTDLKKLMGDVRSYGEPRVTWGSPERSDHRDTTAYLSSEFGRSFRNNLVR